MSDDVSFNISIKPTWSIVRELQQKTSQFMDSKNKSKEITEASIMCATELIENAVKYGTEKPDGSNIDFELHADDKKIIIKVTNGVKSDEDKDNVIEHIAKIKESGDPAQLYTERLMELMENPKPGVSQLGLYRIAYEGEFSLDCTYNNKTLTIVAKRTI